MVLKGYSTNQIQIWLSIEEKQINEATRKKVQPGTQI
jgi:hypothetical protein